MFFGRFSCSKRLFSLFYLVGNAVVCTRRSSKPNKATKRIQGASEQSRTTHVAEAIIVRLPTSQESIGSENIVPVSSRPRINGGHRHSSEQTASHEVKILQCTLMYKMSKWKNHNNNVSHNRSSTPSHHRAACRSSVQVNFGYRSSMSSSESEFNGQ